MNDTVRVLEKKIFGWIQFRNVKSRAVQETLEAEGMQLKIKL